MLSKNLKCLLILLTILLCTSFITENTLDAARYKKYKRVHKKKIKKNVVTTGLDYLIESKYKIIENKNIALITNHTAINKRRHHIVDLFFKSKKIKLKSIFVPEHGLYGKEKEMFDSYKHPKYKIDIHSLFDGTSFKPKEKDLWGIDAIVYDIQFLGTRYDTSLATLVNMMKAAAKERVPFIILDRPIPMNTVRIEGSIPNLEETGNITSILPIPTIPGMTVGELGLFFNKEYEINCNLYVVKMKKLQSYSKLQSN